jgi:PAS domain S-box-containing protein
LAAGSPTPSESLLSAIVQFSDDAIISKDLHSIVTSWNPAAQQMFGYSAEEMIGQSIRVILPPDRQHEEDHVLARIGAGDRVEHFETQRVGKDGAIIDVSLSISPIRDREGRVVGASKIARDISDRMRARAAAERSRQHAAYLAQLSAAFAVSLEPDQVLTTVATLSVPFFADWCAVDIVQATGQIERLTAKHVDPAKVELATRVRDRYEDPRSPTSPAAVIRTGQAALIPSITDKMIVDSAGGDVERIALVRSLGLISYLCLPLTVHGRTIGALTFATAESDRHYDDDDIRIALDAAARTALSYDNARAYEQLQAANQLKDEFLATLSHELRTPLNAILGYARMLRSGILKAERHALALETVERNATTLTQMVEDVLDVSRIAAGKIRLHIQPVDLQAVVRDALATVAPAAEAKGVLVQSVLEPDVGRVSGDPDRLQQVIWNVLSNAVKFTSRNGRVQLRLQRVNSHVELSVSDTGVGIREEFLPHLFERFRQGDSTTTRAHGGLGLGLAIARRIVELHGGRIEASSPGEGQGATFRVALPVMIAHQEVPGEGRVHPRAPSRAAAEFSALTNIVVLAVDDDPDALTLVQEILESAGARVRTAASAMDALQLIAEEPPDVLVSDLGMPAIDGFELIRRIRQMSGAARDLPAAALTAYARSEDRAKTLRSGFEMHLAKPIDPAELIAAVAAMARRRSAVPKSSPRPNS